MGIEGKHQMMFAAAAGVIELGEIPIGGRHGARVRSGLEAKPGRGRALGLYRDVGVSGTSKPQGFGQRRCSPSLARVWLEHGEEDDTDKWARRVSKNRQERCGISWSVGQREGAERVGAHTGLSDWACCDRAFVGGRKGAA